MGGMGKAVETILKVLQNGAEATVTIMDTLLVGHAASPRPYYRMKYEPTRFKGDWAELYRRRQAFYSLLNQLKREGLIKKTQLREKTFWSITRRGREHFTKIWLRNSRRDKTVKSEPPLPKKKYNVRPIKSLVIVSFDVPEYARKRRNWLRAYLVSFGLKKLQKSVWVGKCGIPEEFIRDLKDLEMLAWVQIFSVTRRGTMTNVVSKRA